jgi:tetratricopeptide (TPR) repeat protein
MRLTSGWSSRSSALVRAAALLLMVNGANAALAPPALAAKIMFGTTEYLNKIQDTDIKGPNGETLYLGYKFSHHAFIAPYRATDDGYILGVVMQQRYYPLDAALIARLQAQKLLPSPLPTYSLSWLDYLIGSSLWFVLAGIGVSILFAFRKQGQQKQAVPFAEAGLAHHRTGDLDAAIAEYGKALERNPKLIDVLMLRGHAHKARGEIDRAIADYSKIINIDSKNATALVARGAAFEAKSLVPRAIDDYTRAIKSSKAPVAYFMRANAHLGSGALGAAIKDYTAAIDRHNDFAAAYQNRAAAYAQMGRSDLAQSDSEMAARIAGASPGTQPA